MSEEQKKKWCVYIHRNTVNNKSYIGITSKKPEKRWGANGSQYDQNQPVFHNAIAKYGWENFEHIIWTDNLSEQEAKHIEKLLIAIFKTNCKRYSNPELGYNMTDGGDGMSGYVFTEESKEKMRRPRPSIQGENHPMYGVRKFGEENPNYGNHKLAGENHHMWGKHHSDATKEKISIANSNPSSETREKMRQAKIGLYDGENHPNYGKHRSDSTKNKISISKSGYNAKHTLPIINVGKNAVYYSSAIAENDVGVDHSAILKCCKGQLKTAGGYNWKYVYDYITSSGTVIPGAITLGIITEEEVLTQLNKIKGE